MQIKQATGMIAADCIALEDTNNGLRSALGAGVKTYITVNDYTRHQNFAGAAAVFDDLSDLDHFYTVSGLDFSRPILSKQGISG